MWKGRFVALSCGRAVIDGHMQRDFLEIHHHVTDVHTGKHSRGNVVAPQLTLHLSRLVAQWVSRTYLLRDLYSKLWNPLCHPHLPATPISFSTKLLATAADYFGGISITTWLYDSARICSVVNHLMETKQKIGHGITCLTLDTSVLHNMAIGRS